MRLRRPTDLLLCIALLTGLLSCQNETPAPAPPDATPQPAAETGAYPPLTAVVTTNRGAFSVELYPNKVPILVANFANLVQRGFYDGLEFHYGGPDYRLHVGDPTGTGDASPGYRVEAQFHTDLRTDQPGFVATWGTGRHDLHTQFMVATKPFAKHYLIYAVFGRITDGYDVANSLSSDAGDSIETITLEGDPSRLLVDHAVMVAQWNAALDAKGW